MAHVKRDRAALLKRTRRLKGQVEAVMIEVLEGHAREHLGARSPGELDVLLTVIRRYLR
jgi:DNA-binding FrmR family transcriptional regulator